MAGHSKYANIKHRKAAQDAKKTKIFTKLARQITIAAKMKGLDPETNPSLKLAISKAKYNNLPKDRIDKAIKSAAAIDSSDSAYEEIRYEGYGPCGVPLIIETLTNNKNRTAGEVRSILSRYNGNLGSSGSVTHLFRYVCIIEYKNRADDFEQIFEKSVEAGASDVEEKNGNCIIICPINLANQVKTELEKTLGEADNYTITWQPNILAELGEEEIESVKKAISALEDNDDVQDVYSNLANLELESDDVDDEEGE